MDIAWSLDEKAFILRNSIIASRKAMREHGLRGKP
jgi:hypothetical protein